MSFLRGSANYVWCTTSVLGKGATGAVFQVSPLSVPVWVHPRESHNAAAAINCFLFVFHQPLNLRQGVNKHNGETVAVKTFNQLSHMRPQEVQMREFEVLQKVNHENIVKLLAIEEEQEGRGKVIVMELCTGNAKRWAQHLQSC